jgi:hypothetical protein
MLLSGLTLGWLGRFNSQWLLDYIFTSRDAHSVLRPAKTGEAQIDAIVDRIIKVESNGDPNLKNKRSSALGLGQFLDETGLNLIRTHRPPRTLSTHLDHCQGCGGHYIPAKSYRRQLGSCGGA